VRLEAYDKAVVDDSRNHYKVLRGQCVWKTIIRLGLGKKADIITKHKQQQQQQEKASEVTVIIGYTKWNGGPQLNEMKQTHTPNTSNNNK